MFRNRMLGGVSFLPLFAPEGAAGGAEVDPAEVAAHGDPEFADAPAGAAAPMARKAKPAAVRRRPVKAPLLRLRAMPAAGEGEGAEKAGDPADVEQLQKTVKALTKRLGTVAAEKRDLSKKLQETIAAVPKAGAEPPAAAAGEGEQPQRADFKTQG
jgi:hypothetical protein